MDIREVLKNIKRKRKRPKTLKVKWTREMAEDISKMYGMDINEELEKALAEELQKQITNENINKLFRY